MRIDKILLPTDLSTEGERPLAGVVELARGLKAALVLLHVVENVGIPPGAATSAYLPGTTQELERVRRELEQRRARLPAGITVETHAIVASGVARAIADFARENRCDVIALSTHGRGGFRRLVMGSVAEDVLRHSRVPVLVFPRAE